MPKVVEKVLSITYDNAKEVLVANGVTLAVAATGFAPAVACRIYLSQSSSQYYTYLNSTGLSALYPTTTATPFKADCGVTNASRFSGSTSTSNQMWMYINGYETTHLNVTSSSQDKIDTGITSHIVGSTRDTADIRIYLKHKSALVAVGGDGFVRLYYNQYSASANAVGNGIKTATVSSIEPYQGDTITFSVDLITGATWYGWYSDANCTQLVSTDKDYTITPTDDIVLYAKATSTLIVPEITLGTPSRDKISDEATVDQCVCTFTVNIDCDYWEARAVYNGGSVDRGSGTIVEIGNNLTAGEVGTIIVDDEELLDGDGEYMITLYAHGTTGMWSDGTYMIL